MNAEMQKLTTLAEAYGLTVDELIEEYALDCVVPGICMNPDCEYTAEYEPDQREGYCDMCDTGSVRSALVLAGLI
jgi:hypothetical protein